MKVIILKGLPGSGKTHWAKEYIRNNKNFVRLNKDDFRAMLSFSNYDAEIENLINEVKLRAIPIFLNSGYGVIVDDTNLREEHLHKINSIAHFRKNTMIEVIDHFMDVPIETCIDRCYLREHGNDWEKIIRNMYEKYKDQFAGRG